MKENTQEKKLIERNENSILNKIKKFFLKLFNKKDNYTGKVSEEPTITENNIKFKEYIKIEELDEEKLLDLQRRYRNGEIKKSELTNDEIDKLCALYDRQIDELNETIQSKKHIIEEYRKSRQYRIKKNNA